VKNVYFFIGLPCSGKTYTANVVASKVFNNQSLRVSTGDIARKLIDEQSGREMAKTDLFPGEEALRLELCKTIDNSTEDNIIVDGFPRFDDQVNYMIDQFWIYNPVVIEVNVGDPVTLVNRARFRSRDGRDNTQEFLERLARAQKNMAGVFDVLNRRTVPYYTIMSGADEQIVSQFKFIQKRAYSHGK